MPTLLEIPYQDTLRLLKEHLDEIFRLTVTNNKWIPINHRVTLPNGKGLSEKQAEFLYLQCLEALYGGAAGGGKSDALLMAALQFVDVPNYTAILFRKSYADLTLPDALMDRAIQWLSGTEALWSPKEKTWTFPSSAKLVFGYLATELDKYRYQSSAYQFVGFDETTQFTESIYTYLFSRLRKPEDMLIPLRMRGATNPGGIGHEWVKNRFLIDGARNDRVFIPAKLSDNPNLNQESYIISLNKLDPVTREQLLNGNWDITASGNLFKRSWVQIVEDYPRGYPLARFWDKAATVTDTSDYTSGVLATIANGVGYVLDVVRFKGTPQENQTAIRNTAIMDQRYYGDVAIGMEEEAGSSGKDVSNLYATQVLLGFDFRPERPTGSKIVRFNPVSAMAQNGNLKILKAGWNKDYLEELELFPNGSHDDQVDATSGVFRMLWTGGAVGGGGVSRDWHDRT